MILTEFSKYLQCNKDKIINNETTSTKLLCKWVAKIISRNPKTNVEKIIHKELLLAKNSSNDFLIVAKSESGRILLKALKNFVLSYENYLMSTWISDKRPKHFNISKKKEKN